MTKDILIPSPSIKGLIFDLDGTLADTMPLHIDSWIQVGQEYGVGITAKMINDPAGTEVIHDLNQIHGWTIDAYEFRWRKNDVYHEMKKAAGTIQPVKEIVEIARSNRGIRPMGVGTGSIKANAQLALSDLQISDWFEILVTADDVTDPKPHPETFLTCVQHFGLQPSECLVYEDSPVGIKAAVDGGMHAVNIETLEYFAPEN